MTTSYDSVGREVAKMTKEKLDELKTLLENANGDKAKRRAVWENFFSGGINSVVDAVCQLGVTTSDMQDLVDKVQL